MISLDGKKEKKSDLKIKELQQNVMLHILCLTIFIINGTFLFMKNLLLTQITSC